MSVEGIAQYVGSDVQFVGRGLLSAWRYIIQIYSINLTSLFQHPQEIIRSLYPEQATCVTVIDLAAHSTAGFVDLPIEFCGVHRDRVLSSNE